VQLSFASDDLTTTFCQFNFFLDTRADKSLCYGPGLLPECAINEPVEFIIQARNELDENRTSGRDNFQVTIKTVEEEPEEIVPEIVDADDGKYYVKYSCARDIDVAIKVAYQNNKEQWQTLRGSPYVATFSSAIEPKNNHLTGPAMVKNAQKQIEALQNFMKDTTAGANTKNKDLSDVKSLIGVKDCMEQVFLQKDQKTLLLDQLDESLKFLQTHGISKDKEMKQTKKLFDEWNSLNKLAKDVKKEIAPLVENESKRNTAVITRHEEELKTYVAAMKKRDFYRYDTGRDQALVSLQNVNDEIVDFQDRTDQLKYNAEKFEHPGAIEASETKIGEIRNEVSMMQLLWDHIATCQGIFDGYMLNTWEGTKTDDMEEEVKRLERELKQMKVDKKCNAYIGILEEIKKWLKFLPLCGQLRDESMRDRHWDMIRDKVGVRFTINKETQLKEIYDLELGKIGEDIEEICDQAGQEAKMERTLKMIAETWVSIEFVFRPHKGSDVQMLGLDEENFEMLEEHQTNVNAMFSSRYLATFEESCVKWQKSLAMISEVVLLCGEVQRNWSFLEQLFIHSAEVKKELPKESEQFVTIDQDVKRILNDAFKKKVALDYCAQDWVFPDLEKAEKQLSVCEKALLDFMDSKRRAFPRFYFVAQNDLLDILSNGNNPSKIMIHMPKIFQAIDTLELDESKGEDRPYAMGIHASVGKEFVDFDEPLKLERKVENYLQDVIDRMRRSIKTIAADSLKRFARKEKKDWLQDDPAQVSLLVNLVNWVKAVEAAFESDSMGGAYDNQVDLLKELIFMVQGDLTPGMRQKIMCMITMDAHSRDIIEKLRDEGVKKPDEFQWQSQLKCYWDSFIQDYMFKIADAVLNYGYEYLGNGPRLVITPLTDRIYVTATQALHLCMGCAPAGPAGTGKTETTKDLSSALAKAIYVFNCSDQMDYRGMGGIFKGLASSGSWGCFDEFNRLLPSVLSVCSVQFKSVTDAIKQFHEKFKGETDPSKRTNFRFIIQDDEIGLDPTCGVFITMNPGYLGRAELPEGLKALFRPITVVVPDLELICENMLMAEGFVGAKVLAKKFTTLYALCKDLLSKAAHYDWGLRAIKSVLVVAGKFKRAEPELPEPDLLMRALRDFNLPKIVAEDLQIFMDLLGDLFPGINPPRKRDMNFEESCRDAAKGFGLYPDEEFILKVVQLSELLVVRHCVFVMGPPGAGKSSTWKTLGDANGRNGNKTIIRDLNPKVVKTDELYGVVHMQTREWIDGLMSSTMRSLGQIPDTNAKWIVLDGDLDANWIESMNSVMDDNKILTLASNERIPLKSHMRLIFEIRDLRFATPATVSRAGILFISDTAGYQWKSYVKSWLAAQAYDAERKKELQGYFDQYI
jgi:dynein heavy chain